MSYSKHRHRSLDIERDFNGSLKSESLFSKLVPTNKFGPEFNLCQCGRDFSITDKFLLKEDWQCLSFLGEKKMKKPNCLKAEAEFDKYQVLGENSKRFPVGSCNFEEE